MNPVAEVLHKWAIAIDNSGDNPGCQRKLQPGQRQRCPQERDSMSSPPTRLNLAEGFQRYFQIAPALTDATRNDVYFIRHDVYARELGFEPVRPDQRETDAYDRHSVHCLLRTSQEPARLVGCAR